MKPYDDAFNQLFRKVAQKHGLSVKSAYNLVLKIALKYEPELYNLLEKNERVKVVSLFFKEICQYRFLLHVKIDAEMWLKHIDKALNGKLGDVLDRKISFLKCLSKEQLETLREQHLTLLKSATEVLEKFEFKGENDGNNQKRSLERWERKASY